MRRLLVISYYTPPLGLSGVMRVTKLCKFLPENGWRPLILTVKPAAYYYYDPELLNDLHESRIFRTESMDPARLLNRLRPMRSRLQPALARSLGHGPRLLNYVLFPDSKAGWLPFASVTGRHIIDRERPAAIFATAPPFTSLLIGVRLKAHAHVPLVVDFRDPWPTGFAPPPRWQRRALRWVRDYAVRHADLSLAVNDGTARAVGNGVEVLDNGFDPDDFDVPARQLDGFSVVHVGNLWQNEAEVRTVVRALGRVPDARLYLAGRIDSRLAAELARNPQVELLGTVDHGEACRLMKSADALLYVGKPGQPVGIKLYEYIGSGRPVVVFGQDTDEAAGLVSGCGCGRAARDEAELVEAFNAVARDPARFAGRGRDRFDRRQQARQLAERLEELVVRS